MTIHNNNLAMVELQLLVKFPHIFERIQFMWGDPACRTYLHSLIAGNDRNRDPSKVQGFPFGVMTAIMELLSLHDDEFPKYKPIDTVFDGFR